MSDSLSFDVLFLGLIDAVKIALFSMLGFDENRLSARVYRYGNLRVLMLFSVGTGADVERHLDILTVVT